MFVLYLIISALLSLIPTSIANNKGKSFGLWYLYSFFLWPIAFIHSLCLPNEKRIEEIDVTENSNENGLQQYSLNLPVVITGYSIIKREDKMKLQISLENIGNVVIEALKINAYGYNAFGEPIEIEGKDFFELLIQDIHLKENTATSIVVEQNIPDTTIRKLELKITQVLTDSMPVFAQILNFDIDRKIIKSSEEKEYFYDKNVYFRDLKKIFYPKNNDKYWLCPCGYINSIYSDNCSYCHSNKEEIFSDIEPEIIKQKCLEAENKRKKDKKFFMVSTIAIGIIFVFIMGIYARHYNIQKVEQEKILDSLSDMQEFTKYIGIVIWLDDEALGELKSLLASYNGKIEIFDYETDIEASYNRSTEILDTVTFSLQEAYTKDDYQDILEKLTFLLGEAKNSNGQVNEYSIYRWENVENASLYTDDYASVSNEEEINLELFVEKNKIVMKWYMNEDDEI